MCSLNRFPNWADHLVTQWLCVETSICVIICVTCATLAGYFMHAAQQLCHNQPHPVSQQLQALTGPFSQHTKNIHTTVASRLSTVSVAFYHIYYFCAFLFVEFGWLEMYVYSYQRGNTTIFFLCYNKKTRETCNKRPSVAWVMPYWTIFSDINKDKISYFRHGFK